MPHTAHLPCDEPSILMLPPGESVWVYASLAASCRSLACDDWPFALLQQSPAVTPTEARISYNKAISVLPFGESVWVYATAASRSGGFVGRELPKAALLQHSPAVTTVAACMPCLTSEVLFWKEENPITENCLKNWIKKAAGQSRFRSKKPLSRRHCTTHCVSSHLVKCKTKCLTNGTLRRTI